MKLKNRLIIGFLIIAIVPMLMMTAVTVGFGRYQMRVMNKELTITGIFGRRMFETWELAKELVVSGHVKLERFIGEIMPLTDFDRGAKIAPKTFGRIVYLP